MEKISFSWNSQRAAQRSIADILLSRIISKGRALSNAEMYTLDCAAEFHGLPTNRLWEVTPEQLREYLLSDNFSCQLGSNYFHAVGIFNAQLEKRTGEETGRALVYSQMLDSMRSKLGITEEMVPPHLIALLLYEAEVGRYWKSSIAKFDGINKRVVGCEEARKTDEAFENTFPGAAKG